MTKEKCEKCTEKRLKEETVEILSKYKKKKDNLIKILEEGIALLVSYLEIASCDISISIASFNWLIFLFSLIFFKLSILPSVVIIWSIIILYYEKISKNVILVIYKYEYKLYNEIKRRNQNV